ncbi:putative ribonuclease H-like domain-containing protein [Tanacetum coccineum]
MELMEKRRKHFAALRAQEKRNRPPTKAQKRTQMSTYLKHMAMGFEVQENKEKKEEGREETAKGNRKKMLGRKRAVKEQQKESSKKLKVEEEKESEEVEEDDEVKLKKLLVIKKDEDIAIDTILLATKFPVIIKCKLHKEGMLVHYELIRADGSSKRYSSMIRMLQGIDREDLEALWRIVKGKYGDTRPEDEFERTYALWEVIENGDLWVPISQTTEENGITTLKMSTPATAEEKIKRKNDVKARGLLLHRHFQMRHQCWTFQSIPYANLLLLPLKQDLEASEDIVWMNKPEIETMSIDDLYNNFKIVEPKDKEDRCAASPSVNTASPQVYTASVSDNIVYAFMNENPNGSNVLHQDLEQINKDDLEAMDLKWQLSLLSVIAKRVYQRQARRFSLIVMILLDMINLRWSVTTVISWDTLPGSAEHQEARKINSEIKTTPGSKETKKTLPRQYSEVYTDKTCSKTCLNNYETLKKQYDDLLAKQLQTKFESATYKRGLDTVEAQLVTYRKNEVLFSEEVVVLKREVEFKQYEINTLKVEFEKLKKEKDNIDFKIEKFDKASKDLDQLLESQITDKSKKGFGYSAVPPPHPLIYNRPNKLDLSYSGLDEFKEPEFKGYGPENSKKESNIVKESDNSKENSNKSLVKELESQVKSRFVKGCGSNTSERVSEVEPKKVRENNDAPIIEDWVSDDEEQDESITKPEKKTITPTAAKIEKPVRKSVRYAEMYRSQRPRGNQRNWNGQKSIQLGSEFVMYNKACFNCGSFNHVQRNCTYHQIKKVVNTVRPRIINTARSYRTPVNTVRPRVINTARQNRTSVNAARANGFNTGKLQHDDKGFVDNGCSRHMTGNIAYLSNFKQFDGGYVAFGGGAYGGKILGKGTLKTANLDFEDILLKVPRNDNMYSFDMKNIIPKESLTCLVAKATLDESMLWRKTLGHII